jgi:futalosine hydrolase
MDDRFAFAAIAIPAIANQETSGRIFHPVSLLLCVATDLESELLRKRLADVPSIEIVRMGVGPVNAAHAVTLAIATNKPTQILVCGIGGAYPASGLGVGDVVCADVEVYGDLGAQSPSGFLDMRTLGFPVVDAKTPLFNEIPMQLFPLKHRVRFITVSTCTGTESDARAIELRTGGAVENMEGAAVAHVAHLHGVPVGEVRGISNTVTNRDTKSWRIRDAAVAAQEAVLTWVQTVGLQNLKASRPQGR